jgi:hypothetical protein
MSTKTQTEADFELHDNGSIFWNSVHHVSWISDDNQRVYSSNISILVGPEELAICQGLANSFDSKGK